MEEEITNQVLYDYLKEYREETNRRFEQVQSQFKQVQVQFEHVRGDLQAFKEETIRNFEGIRRELSEFKDETRANFGHIERRLERIEDVQRDQERKLEKVYECRDKVTVSFKKGWAAASFFIAIFAVMLTLAFDKAF